MHRRLADIVTNTANKYTISFYAVSNVLSKDVSGLHGVTNSPHTTAVVENPGNDTNKVRVTFTREGQDTVYDYTWLTNGWELSSGGGLRREIKTVAWTETNTLKTVTQQILNGSGSVVFQRIEKYRTNSAYYGQRLIEDATGTGPSALTNSYTWTTNGYLQQEVHADGSWAFYVYDSLNRPTNIYSSFGNQPLTTNKALCRFTEHTYTTNFTGGSGDDGTREIYRPRRTVEYVLNQEVGRSYFVALYGQWQNYRCVNPGAAWNSASNLVTVTRVYTNGFHVNEPFTVTHPDGSLDVFRYAINRNRLTNTVLHGHPDGSGTNIDDGTRTVSVYDSGNLLSGTVIDVASGITLDSETYSYDGYNRRTNTVYLDGTSRTAIYGCCGISSDTDREGTVTTYTYDALKRMLTTTRNGITVSNIYDAAGNVLATTRYGTNGSAISLNSALFDDAGRQISLTDAFGNTTTFTNYINGSGQIIRQTTHPNLSSRVESFNQDGQLASVTGTAVHGVRYDYGVESESGTQRSYSKEIKLDTGGGDTTEWTKSYRDMLGRNYKLVYPDGANSQTFFNTNGQAIKHVDPDGVTTLSQYDSHGDLEYTAIDMDANGAIDFAGTDRITRSVHVVTNNGISNVRRVSIYAWSTTNLDSATLLSVNETSTDGLRTWNAAFGTTNQFRALYSSGHRFVTNTATDGSFAVSDFQNGLILSVTRKDSAGVQIGQTTYGYDPHGRQSLITDARTGTITNVFDNADRLVSVSTPAPASGQAAQVTTTIYNNMGQVATNTLPDNGVVSSLYHVTGELATNAGARIYPVAYTYDYAGRMKTMTTWTNYASAAGAAVTTWNYDTQRGWLTNKAYADGLGPKYGYTAAGRLQSRLWARGVTTTYGYSGGGELMTTDYSDATSDVTNTYDRRSRIVAVDVGGTVTTSRIYQDAGQLLSETYTGGELNGLGISNRFDSLFRRTSLMVLPTSMIVTQNFGYDSASRLASASYWAVGFATSAAEYTYLTNSDLISTITFKQNGTTRAVTSKFYDNLNRATQFLTTTGGLNVANFAYLYNAANQRLAVTNLDGRWAYTYDSLGQVTSGKRYWTDGDIMAGHQFDYGFDEIGNRTFAGASGDQWGANVRYQNYAANSLNQYTQRTYPGYLNVMGSASNTATVTVNDQPTYRKGDFYRAELRINNSAGASLPAITNRAVLNNASGTNDLVIDLRGNYIMQPATQVFQYDADGNLTNDGVWSYTWDAENRLTRLQDPGPLAIRKRIDFGYDSQSRRQWKKVSLWNGSTYVGSSTNRFIYDQWNLLGEWNHTNGLINGFVWGIDLSGTLQGAGGVGGLLLVNNTAKGVRFAVSDANGNVSLLLNAANGTEAARYEYGPFGELLRASSSTALLNPIRFSSKYHDDETDMLYYGYRYYGCNTGRWLSRDPVWEPGIQKLSGADENTQTMSMSIEAKAEAEYGFNWNCSTGYIDPFGERPVGAVQMSPPVTIPGVGKPPTIPGIPGTPDGPPVAKMPRVWRIPVRPGPGLLFAVGPSIGPSVLHAIGKCTPDPKKPDRDRCHQNCHNKRETADEKCKEKPTPREIAFCYEESARQLSRCLAECNDEFPVPGLPHPAVPPRHPNWPDPLPPNWPPKK